MSDALLKKLGEMETGLNDFQKSTKAEVSAAKNGVEELKTSLDATKRQLQEVAELVKKGIPSDKRDFFHDFGKAIAKSFRGGEQRAASGGADATGGYLVADEFIHEIRSAQNRYGVVRQIFGASIVPMASDVVKVPVDTFEDTSGNVPVPTATSENAQITASDDARLDQVTLTASKYATLNYVSNELLADAFTPFLGAYLFPKLIRQKSKKEDGIVFTTASTGLFNSSNIQSYSLASGNTNFTDVTADDYILATDSVVDDALDEGMYLLHRSMVSHARTLKGSDGQFLWTPLAAGEPATINGYPYMRAAICPARSATAAATGFALFGDPRLACVVGEKNDMRLDTSKDFRFDYDQVAVRLVFRFAFNTNANIGRALVRMVTAAS